MGKKGRKGGALIEVRPGRDGGSGMDIVYYTPKHHPLYPLIAIHPRPCFPLPPSVFLPTLLLARFPTEYRLPESGPAALLGRLIDAVRVKVFRALRPGESCQSLSYPRL